MLSYILNLTKNYEAKRFEAERFLKRKEEEERELIATIKSSLNTAQNIGLVFAPVNPTLPPQCKYNTYRVCEAVKFWCDSEACRAFIAEKLPIVNVATLKIYLHAVYLVKS